MTLTVPGTAHSVISVGSVGVSVSALGNRQFKVAVDSSYGPTRDGRSKPDLAAPGEDITAAQGNTLNGSISYSGTSMAAPHVTGAIALLLSYWEKQQRSRPGCKPLNAAQIRAAICELAQNYGGQWDPGMGFGVLDAEQLVNMFD